MKKLNYFLPVQVGAPDYKKIIRQFTAQRAHLNSSADSTFTPQIGPYIAGLWEGSGHVWIPQFIHSPSGKTYIPQFCITFCESDYPLAVKLKSLLGGSIRFKKENHAYVLTLASIADLTNVINLINGYLRGPKLEHFKALINWLNKHKNTNFYCKDKDTSNLLNNSWLSGFIDAEGSFDIRISLVKNGALKNRIAARFRLEQQKIDTKSSLSYFDLMNDISKTLLVSLSTSIHGRTAVNKEYFLISVSSEKSRLELVNYLNKYPLFTGKILDYKNWLNCHYEICNKTHTTNKGIEVALLNKSQMNTKRTYYNWDHLSLLNNC